MLQRVARRFGAFLVLIAVVILPARAQQPPSTQRAGGSVNANVRAVLVDVVVRDKRGNLVKDLAQSDFELLEDGVAQQVGSFSPVFDGNVQAAPLASTASAPAAKAPAVGSAPAEDSGPTVTALVFDRLGPEARKLAVQAAQNYFGTMEEAPSYFGVFGVDLSLTSYAPFTRNVRVLREALNKMNLRASSSFNNADQKEQRAQLEKDAASADQGAQSAAGQGQGAQAAMGTAPAAAQLAQMQANMLKDFELMEHDQEGYATTNGLFAIISQMRKLPGRKSMVFFSEGVSIPPAVHRLFIGVIDAANRANVSVYTMDAAGLRGVSEQSKIRDQVNASAKRGIEGGYANESRLGADPLTKDLENNEYVLRQDPHMGLGELAQGTGGLLFENTNNLRPAFDRIESDLRNYYLLGYTPTNDKYDGRFRTIDVRVKRPGVTVAARKGYYAVRDTGGTPINPWEALGLAALDMRPVPNAFPMRAGALLFPERDRPSLVPIVVDLKTAPLTFQAAEDGKTYTSDFAVIVRLLDSQGQVTRKLSQHYEVRGPIGDLERAKQGEVIFYREPELPSGVYTMEAIVYDTPTNRASVRFSTVEVPKSDTTKLRMSSLMLVKRGEKIPEKDRRAGNPLLVNDVLLYPNLGEPISKSAKEFGFYFAAYPAAGGQAPVGALELIDNNGKTIAQLPIELAKASADGRIQQTGRLPLDRIAPGTYELRAIVKQGSEQVFRSAMLNIVE
jgi:VWFA-related protein